MPNRKLSNEAGTTALEPEQPFAAKLSDRQNAARLVPIHNAKIIKEAMENGTAPFLPDKDGSISAEPIYNANTGYCLNAKDLIPLQIEKQHGYSNIVVTKNTVDAADTKIKKDVEGFFYNYKRSDGRFGTTQFFFPEQTENPERILENAGQKIGSRAKNRNSENVRTMGKIEITTAEPVEYLANYVAGCKAGCLVSCSPEIAEQFKQNFGKILENQIAEKDSRDEKIPLLNNLFFDADKKSFEIAKQITKQAQQEKQQEKHPRKQKKEMSR